MRTSGKRLPVRDLVIAVAAFALSLKIGLTYSRSGRYWKEADFYSNALASARSMLDALESEYKPPRIIPVVGMTGISIVEGVGPTAVLNRMAYVSSSGRLGRDPAIGQSWVSTQPTRNSPEALSNATRL